LLQYLRQGVTVVRVARHRATRGPENRPANRFPRAGPERNLFRPGSSHAAPRLGASNQKR
jgi:hypothetical protein